MSFLNKYDSDQFEFIQFRRDDNFVTRGFCLQRIKIVKLNNSLYIPCQAGLSLKWLYAGLKEAHFDEGLTYCSGVMGVPISFLDKYCPEQFNVLGLFTETLGPGFIQGTKVYVDERHPKSFCPVLNGKRVYPRVLIQVRG